MVYKFPTVTETLKTQLDIIGVFNTQYTLSLDDDKWPNSGVMTATQVINAKFQGKDGGEYFQNVIIEHKFNDRSVDTALQNLLLVSQRMITSVTGKVVTQEHYTKGD